MSDLKNPHIRESDERLLAEMRVSKAEDSLLVQQSWRRMWTPIKREESPTSQAQSPRIEDMNKYRQSINQELKRFRNQGIEDSPLTSSESFFESPTHSVSRTVSRRNAQRKDIEFESQGSKPGRHDKHSQIRASAQQLIAMATSGEKLPQPVGITPEIVIEIIRQIKGSLTLNDLVMLINHLQNNDLGSCSTEPDQRSLELSESLKRSEQEIGRKNTEISHLKDQVKLQLNVINGSHDLMAEIRQRWRKDRRALHKLKQASRNSGSQHQPPLQPVKPQNDSENLPVVPECSEQMEEEIEKYKKRAEEAENECNTLREVLNALLRKKDSEEF